MDSHPVFLHSLTKRSRGGGGQFKTVTQWSPQGAKAIILYCQWQRQIQAHYFLETARANVSVSRLPPTRLNPPQLWDDRRTRAPLGGSDFQGALHSEVKAHESPSGSPTSSTSWRNSYSTPWIWWVWVSLSVWKKEKEKLGLTLGLDPVSSQKWLFSISWVRSGFIWKGNLKVACQSQQNLK